MSGHTSVLFPADPAKGQVDALQSRIAEMQATKLETRALPTLPGLADVLPGGTLRQGAVYSVDGSMSLVMALLAAPSQAGSWCGIVGVPDFGAEAASRFGIELERLVLVPTPGEQWLTVTAALVDVLGVVVSRPARQVRDADAARLAARLRQRGCTLIVVGDWPQSEARLRISASRWNGLGQGNGYLAGREVTVTAEVRTGRERVRVTRLWLPDEGLRFSAAERPRGRLDSAPLGATG